MNDFVKLLIDTAKGCPTKYSVAESNEAINRRFFEILGIDKTSNVKEIRKAVRRHKAEIYEIIEEVIDERLVSGWGDNPFFREFVEEKNLAHGDTNEFYIPDNSILTVSQFSGNHHDLIRQKLGMGEYRSITTSWYGIKVYEEFIRYMAGRIDWAMYIEKLYEAVDKKVNDMLYEAFLGLDAELPPAYAFSGSPTEEEILSMAEKVQTANGGKEVIIAGPRTALAKITALTNTTMWSDEMKNTRNTLGGLGVWNGIRLVRVPQVFEQGTREFMFPENKFFILPMTDNKPIKLVNEGDSMYNEVGDYTTNRDMTIEAEYLFRMGIATIVGADFATGTLA